MWIEIATDFSSLEKHRAAWDDLAVHALEPNPFMESFLFLPSLRQYGPGKDLLFLFVYGPNQVANGTPTLCGFFPLLRRRTFKGLPIGCLQLWGHECLLSTPLIRRDKGRETWQCFLDWLATDPESCSLIEFPMLPGEGPVCQHLVDEIRGRSLLSFQSDCFTRALLCRRESGDAYLQEALSSNRRRDYKRKENRLADLGKLDYRTLESANDLPAWIDWFLQIEASGWKGAEGTALACSTANFSFFREATQAAFKNGQLQLLGLFLDEKPIAIRCNFISGHGSFFYKPAYDESYAKNSPGVLVELQNIRELHRDPRIRFMDSCTSSDNGLLNDLWLDRVILQNLILATGKGWGRMAVSTLPLFRWLRKLGHAPAATK
jgi:CelD/BcsL family acetyltransferase involved in cellulose biosynthesis